jgi:hypothetical protein
LKTFWDSSALLNALVSKTVVDRLEVGEHFTRAHAFAEVFHNLTGRGLPVKGGGRVRVAPSDAAKMVRSLSLKLPTRNLCTEETLAALDDASGLGVQGGRVHDLMHARAAKLDGAGLILTRDLSLGELSGGIASEWP